MKEKPARCTCRRRRASTCSLSAGTASRYVHSQAIVLGPFKRNGLGQSSTGFVFERLLVITDCPGLEYVRGHRDRLSDPEAMSLTAVPVL